MRKTQKIVSTSVVIASVVLNLGSMLGGCDTPGWGNPLPPDLTGARSMEAVEAFVRTNGWNMLGTNFVMFGMSLYNPPPIRGLPWRSIRRREFPAFTHDGILYVVTGGWHHDWYGVAYNPETNRFHPTIQGFKPVGGHWYVWLQPEFPVGFEKTYEGE